MSHWYQQTEWRAESLKIAQTIAQHATKRGTTSVAFAIAWVLKNPLISAAIAGPRTEAHWDSYMQALGLELGPDDETLVDSLAMPRPTVSPIRGTRWKVAKWADPLDRMCGRWPCGWSRKRCRSEAVSGALQSLHILDNPLLNPEKADAPSSVKFNLVGVRR